MTWVKPGIALRQRKDTRPDPLFTLKIVLVRDMKQTLKRAGYAEEFFHVESIISDPQLRNGIIRDLYAHMKEGGMKNIEAMRAIEERFNIGENYLKKILFERIVKDNNEELEEGNDALDK